ncbi:putative imidazolonepropionase-like isoform X2, partial [Dinothrombium tinctorium]
MDIHNKGGGIHYTVDETRKATFEQLLQSFEIRLRNMIKCGTTLVECKTGYGLEFETELKMLRVIDHVKRNNRNVDLVVNFLGAHSVPKGMTADEGAAAVIEMMQRIKSEAPELGIDFVDVFCEKGVYDTKQSREILLRGSEIFDARIGFHGDELSSMGCAELAKEINARSVSHLEFITPSGIASMAEANSVAIVCPTTAYLLRLKSPPVRDMIDAAVPVAIASDFNPNAHCYSLPMAMNLAVVNFRMSLNEALIASTINAAFALDRSATHGSLEIGKFADMILVNAKDWRHLIYEFGDTQNVIKSVIKRGVVFK